jgi:hypothetical protein
MNEEQNIPKPDTEEKTKSKEVKNEQSSNPGQLVTKQQESNNQQPQTSNTGLQTTHMDTHAQHLHKAPGQKWTHYLFEFLMLFLAVFCGFLAENQREHIIEQKREKQFVQSLINDLRLDAATFDTVSNARRSRIRELDTAILYLSRVQTNEMPLRIYQYLQESISQRMFLPNNGTITQLKNSGGLRLIRNRQAVDFIERYDRQQRRLEIIRAISIELGHDLTEALYRTVDSKDVVSGLYDSLFYDKKVNPEKVIRLNDQSLNELINKCIALRLRTGSDITVYNNIKRVALSLVEFLIKEYHLSASGQVPSKK